MHDGRVATVGPNRTAKFILERSRPGSPLTARLALACVREFRDRDETRRDGQSRQVEKQRSRKNKQSSSNPIQRGGVSFFCFSAQLTQGSISAERRDETTASCLSKRILLDTIMGIVGALMYSVYSIDRVKKQLKLARSPKSKVKANIGGAVARLAG